MEAWGRKVMMRISQAIKGELRVQKTNLNKETGDVDAHDLAT
jgi:hypothetical protein